MFVDKETRQVKIVDRASPGDTRVKQREVKKWRNTSCQVTKDEIGRLWNMRNVCVVSVVVGALGMISKGS